jgi:hypothetical protein
MAYNYLLVRLSYINLAHAEDRDMESDDDETVMVTNIQKIYFSTPNISTIFEKLNDVPFGDSVHFDKTEEKVVKRFEEQRKYSKDMETITQEIGVYFENHVAKYFICIAQVPVIN